MRFIVSSLALIASSNATFQKVATRVHNACDEGVVNQAARDGFLKYMIANCLDADNVNHINYNLTATVSPTDCLSNWIDTHQSGPYPIPQSGTCRMAYQHLIYMAEHSWRTLIMTPVVGCSYDPTTGELVITDICADTFMNAGGATLAPDIVSEFTADPTVLAPAALDFFLYESGYHLGGDIQCLPITVRKWAMNNAYEVLVKQATGYPQGSPTVPNDHTSAFAQMMNSNGKTDNGNGLCYECYHIFSRSITAYNDIDGYASVFTFYIDCNADPFSDACMQSTGIQDALANFKICSGGFDMTFSDAMCSGDHSDLIQSIMVPSPYFTLAHCAYDPHSDYYCRFLQSSYLAYIASISNENCGACYQDFYNSVLAVKNYLADNNIESKCVGDNDVWDPNCLAELGQPLLQFEACSGYALNVINTTSGN